MKIISANKIVGTNPSAHVKPLLQAKGMRCAYCGIKSFVGFLFVILLIKFILSGFIIDVFLELNYEDFAVAFLGFGFRIYLHLAKED